MTDNRLRHLPADIIDTLVENEGRDVTLRFEENVSMPSEGFSNHSYTTETLQERNITVTVELADIEDGGTTLICFVTISHEEKMRLGLNPDAVGERDVNIEITSNDHDDDGWDRPTAYVVPKMTDNGARQHVESGYSLATSAPLHEVGTLRAITTDS